MPIFSHSFDLIRTNLLAVSKGEHAKIITIGELTDVQFTQINIWREQNDFPLLELPEVVYLGRHHHESRSKDGYNIEDMILQLEQGLHESSIVKITKKMTVLQSINSRNDGYGNNVTDAVVLELTARKPRAEAFSAIPYGDKNKPKK